MIVRHAASCRLSRFPLGPCLLEVAPPKVSAMQKMFGLVIHGGAGVIRRETLPPAWEAEYRAGLREALDAGHAALAQGGSALDAVIAALVLLEDNPLFNAGRGAALNADGLC